MKKTLFLVRHAKSSRDGIALPDRERPLADRGRLDAPKMAKRLARRKVKPDLILSSPARRALSTAEIFADELGYKASNIVVDDRLYAAEPEVLLDVIGAFPDKVKCLMIFGHNPEFADLAQRLSGDIDQMPTCAVAEFVFDAKSWSGIAATKPSQVVLDFPKKA